MTGFARGAQTPEDQYLAIFSSMAQADRLKTAGQFSEAYAKYAQAQAALVALKRENPNWGTRIIAYRLNYLVDALAATADKHGPADTSTEAASPASRGSDIKLLDAGAEPRALLRLHPTVGGQQSLVLDIKMGMNMEMSGQPMPAMKLPAMQINMDTTVKEVAANGDISYELVLGEATVANDPDVTPVMADAIKASLARFHGLTGSGKLSERGFNLGFEMKTPDDADPQARQTLDQMKANLANTACPLPEEPVGPGARWEVRTKLKSQGMTLDQTGTYELVSNTDGRLVLNIHMTQSAANQKMQSPTMPGAKLDLTKMTGDGNGASTIDLGKLLPIAGNLTSQVEMAMSFNVAGKKQAMTTKMDVDLHFAAK